MKLLLDTHALLWWLQGGSDMSRRASDVIQSQENSVIVSAATAWEIAIKAQQGKLHAAPLLSDFAGELADEAFLELPILSHHAIRAGLLPGAHKDPFDRMLIAQAQSENLTILSKDKRFDGYGVRRIW